MGGCSVLVKRCDAKKAVYTIRSIINETIFFLNIKVGLDLNLNLSATSSIAFLPALLY